MEWMCVICGFDNRPRNKHCSMCGTNHEFSSNYKAKKMESRRRREERRIKIAERKRMLTSVTSDLRNSAEPITSGAAANTTTAAGAAANSVTEDNDDEEAGLLPPSPSRRSYRLSSTRSAAPNPIILPDSAQVSSISLSLRQFNALPLTHEERVEAIDYRRINALTLRQKSARRRKLWQRAYDPVLGMVWKRVPVRKTVIGQGRFGYTPRNSISLSQIPDSDSDTSSLLPDASIDPSGMSVISNPIAALLSASRSPQPSVAGYVAPGFLSTPTRRGNRDSFDDSAFVSCSPGFTSALDEDGEAVWRKIESGQQVSTHPLLTLGQPQQQQQQLRMGSPMQRLPYEAYRADSPFRSQDPQSSERKSDEDSTSRIAIANDRVDLLAVAAFTFKDKQLWFIEQSAQLATPVTQGFMRINISRANILADSFSAIMSVSTQDMSKIFKYNFINEMGIDAGGLEREWYSLIIQELFSPTAGFFVPCSSKSSGSTYHINPLVHLLYSDANPTRQFGGLPFVSSANYLNYYIFIGRVLGKALLTQQCVAATLSLPLRKQILNVPVTFSDLEFIDDELYNNLCYLQRNDNISSLSLDFSVSFAFGGRTYTHDLLPGGQDVPVTDENKSEYLLLRLKHRMLDSVKAPLEHLLRGFYEVIPLQIISVFDYMELDLLLCGVQDVSLEDWKRHTEYVGDYSPRHPCIRWFWRAVEAMEPEERVRLLQFTTGCARLPVQGFKALQSNDGRYRKFNIQPITKSVRLAFMLSWTVLLLCSAVVAFPILKQRFGFHHLLTATA